MKGCCQVNQLIDRHFIRRYDYKSSLVNVPSHLFAQTVGEIYGALSQEVASLDAEALTAAYDIYNIEAEALGGIVARNSAE